jgi:hypothetical protein
MPIFTGTGAADTIISGFVSVGVVGVGAPADFQADTLYGGGGDDTLDAGGGGGDASYGGRGDDYIYSSFDVDSCYGGAGVDTLDTTFGWRTIK